MDALPTAEASYIISFELLANVHQRGRASTTLCVAAVSLRVGLYMHVYYIVRTYIVQRWN